MSPLDLSKRRLNPLVDRYVTTDLHLLDIARSASSRHPLPTALLLMQESLIGKRLAKDAIAAAKSVPIKGSDPELMIIMLSSWAELSSHIGRPLETEALIHRAKSLLGDDTHPEVRACVLFTEAVLANATGNKARCEELIRQILSLIPEHSPRRKFYVWELALFLAQQGRGIECQGEVRDLTWHCNERFDAGRILMVQFVNAVETGAIQEASELMPQIATSSHQSRELTRIPYRGYQALLRLMHESVAGKGFVPPDIEEKKRPVWIEVVHRLLARNTGEALRLARLQADRVLGSIFGSGFDSFSLVRAELSDGRAEAARHLLEMRRGRGNRHYLDDFFFARAEMLDGNGRLAAARFAEVLKSVEFYKAGGRMDFELKLACELSRGDIVELTREAEKLAGKQKAQRRGKREAKALAARGTPEKKTEKESTPVRVAGTIIGRSPAVKKIRHVILQIADLDAPVLITGETGTGKELVAHALHDTSKKRRHPFTPVNCSSITESLLESELFGYERGAFTGAERTTKGLFEATGKGTIFLDEIGDISPRLQLALLRVLETGEIRAVGSTRLRKIECRVVAATNADLAEAEGADLFRRDLFFRLQRLMIHVPPLRERPGDILPLLRHFLDMGRRVGAHATLSRQLVEAIKAYDWPGNVRELKNVVERMRLMHSDKLTYGIDDLDLKFLSAAVAESEARVGKPEDDRPGPAAERAATERPSPAAEEAASAANLGSFLRGGRSQIRRLDRIRELFTKYGKLTRSEVISILAVSPNTATKDLKQLCDEGFAERVEPTASTRSHYFVVKK